MRGHNVCFHGILRKIILVAPPLNHLCEPEWRQVHFGRITDVFSIQKSEKLHKSCQTIMFEAVLLLLFFIFQIHWLSIINSMVLVFLLIGFVVIILVSKP